jgi:hypothetical protein
MRVAMDPQRDRAPLDRGAAGLWDGALDGIADG